MSAADFIPASARHLLNRLFGAATVYRGPYADWQAAQAASAGYDQAEILARVRDATAKVLRGEADYEQDGVALRGRPPASAALDALLRAAAVDRRLSVLDFGGSLGSHYLRWKSALSDVPQVSWHVVEQAAYVTTGKALLGGEPALSFHTSIEEAARRAPNAILASSALQYLPDALGTLRQLVASGPRVIVLDRMLFSDDDASHILTQHVPRTLGRASYPLWLLPREIVYAELRGNYELIDEFDSVDAPLRAGKLRGTYRGCAWLRKGSA